MNTGQKIKEGDWFCAIEGLAIADKIMISILRNLIKFPKAIKWEITRCQLFNIGCSVILTEIR